MRAMVPILVALLLVGGVARAQTYDIRTFNARLAPLNEDDAIVELCRDFMLNADDIDVQRRAEDTWNEVAPESALDYARQKATDNPTSPRHVYLLGRLVDDRMNAVELGRTAVRLDPTWPYGYRLVLAQYAAGLFNVDRSTPESRQLEAEWPEDEPLLARLLELAPDEAYVQQFVMQAGFYAHDYERALHAIEIGEGLGASWADGLARAKAYAGMGRYDEALAAVSEEVDRRIRDWNGSLEFRKEMVSKYYVDALRAVEAYEKGVAYLLQDSAALNAGGYYDIACLYALAGKREPAFRYLSLAGEHGWWKVKETRENLDLQTLREDRRFTPLMNVYVSNRENGREARREKALSRRVDLEAPDWSLPDADGNLVALSDLRGKIVVLNFWATWCAPCKLAMPTIDEFVKNHGDSTVAVFCVDVWEKGKAGPLKYMRDHDYAMALLYGTDELARAYGVEAIPHLFVIDKNGRIRFVESGVSGDLQETLGFWARDLAEES